MCWVLRAVQGVNPKALCRHKSSRCHLWMLWITSWHPDDTWRQNLSPQSRPTKLSSSGKFWVAPCSPVVNQHPELKIPFNAGFTSVWEDEFLFRQPGCCLCSLIKTAFSLLSEHIEYHSASSFTVAWSKKADQTTLPLFRATASSPATFQPHSPDHNHKSALSADLPKQIPIALG